MSRFIMSQFLRGVDLDEFDVGYKTKDMNAEATIEAAEGRTELQDRGEYLSDSEFVQRSLEENQFWLRIMMEHAMFLRNGFPPDAQELIKQALRFEEAFEIQLERSFETPSSLEAVRRLNQDSLSLTRKIIMFKQKALDDVLNGTVRGFNFPLLLEHVRREAMYFLKTLQRINSRSKRPVDDDIVEENIFFLQIMADHAKFIAHLLDPTEKELIRLANAFGQEFDVLSSQARNLHFEPLTSDILSTQLTVFKGSTLHLRSFKEQATKLVQMSQIRSVIDPRLASHVTREAQKFLSIIDRLEQRLDDAKTGESQLQGSVTVSPTPIISGQQVSVRYNGLLANSGAETIYLHVGYGENQKEWDNGSDMKMNRTDSGWEKTFEIKGVSKLNLCFKDSANNWDDNDERNWGYEIRNREHSEYLQ